MIGQDVVVHPALTPLRKIGMEAATLCNALGLTPAGRQALGLELLEPDPPDWLDESRETRDLRRARATTSIRPGHSACQPQRSPTSVGRRACHRSELDARHCGGLENGCNGALPTDMTAALLRQPQCFEGLGLIGEPL